MSVICKHCIAEERKEEALRAKYKKAQDMATKVAEKATKKLNAENLRLYKAYLKHDNKYDQAYFEAYEKAYKLALKKLGLKK